MRQSCFLNVSDDINPIYPCFRPSVRSATCFLPARLPVKSSWQFKLPQPCLEGSSDLTKICGSDGFTCIKPGFTSLTIRATGRLCNKKFSLLQSLTSLGKGLTILQNFVSNKICKMIFLIIFQQRWSERLWPWERNSRVRGLWYGGLRQGGIIFSHAQRKQENARRKYLPVSRNCLVPTEKSASEVLYREQIFMGTA